MIEHPAKIFPCDCMGEGLVVVRQDELLDDCIESSYIEIGFWNFGHISEKRDWKWRLRTCWLILRKGTCWTDMVMFKKRTARNFANHILYLLGKKPKINVGNLLVKTGFEKVTAMDNEEEPHPMLCVQHGGSPTGEVINEKYGFYCPKCKEFEEDANIIYDL